MSGLGAKRTILGTASGLGVDDGTELNCFARKLFANSVSAVQEEGKLVIFDNQELSRCGRRNPFTIQGLLNTLFNEL
jgi:hypothetical protein